jgi:exonuclease SbcD
MKILHTSDWHLGKRLEGFSRQKEQETVLQEICDIADREQVQSIVIAGDLFDTFNPSTEAVELFYHYTKKLTNNGTRPVIAIAGNHDSPERIEAPDPLARECGILFSGFPHTSIPAFELPTGLKVLKSVPGFIELQLPQSEYPLRLILTPYANEIRLKSYLGNNDTEAELRAVLNDHWSTLATNHCDDQGVNLMITHLLFMNVGDEQPTEPEEERSILHIGGAPAIYTESIPKQIQYVALGHLHRKQTISTIPCPVIYSGSPLAYSFGEADQDKYVMLIDVEPAQPAQVTPILLNAGKRLIRKRFESIDLAVEWLTENQESFVELTIVSDTYLSVTDRKRILDIHEGIVTIIPEMRNLDGIVGKGGIAIDLTKNIEELFIDFYQSKKGGQAPNERILNVLKEALSEEDEV